MRDLGDCGGVDIHGFVAGAIGIAPDGVHDIEVFGGAGRGSGRGGIGGWDDVIHLVGIEGPVIVCGVLGVLVQESLFAVGRTCSCSRCHTSKLDKEKECLCETKI